MGLKMMTGRAGRGDLICYPAAMATKRSNQRKDFTQVAHAVFVQATGGPPVKTAKQLAGRKGGQVGGKKRMAAADEAEKKRLSALGVAARKKKTPAVEAGAKIAK